MTEEKYTAYLHCLKEEIADTRKYAGMKAEAEGYAHSVLCGIVNDEESHARYLRDVILMAGRMIPEEIEAEYQEMQTMFHQSNR